MPDAWQTNADNATGMLPEFKGHYGLQLISQQFSLHNFNKFTFVIFDLHLRNPFNSN